MFNRINLKLPRLSFRTFLFSLFGLLILVLAVEGGYYWWLTRKRFVSLGEIKKKMTELKNDPYQEYQGGVLSRVIINDETAELLIVGTVKRISDSTLFLESEATQQRIQVKIAPDANLMVISREGRHAGRGLDDLKENLSEGDYIAVAEIEIQEEVPVGSEVWIYKK